MSAANAQSTCLTPDLEQALTVQRDVGGLLLYAVPEVSEDHINHVRYMLDRLLIRDDKKDGKIRQSLKDAKVVFLMFEDGEDSEEFEYQMENEMSGCMPIPIIGIEVHYLGSLAEQHGMVDESFADITETVYYYGIKKAYPGWVSRLERAQRSAYADGRFNPHVAIEPDPRNLWDIQYLVIGLEVYYGFWKDKEQVRNGEFNYKTREEMQELDPILFQLIEEIFPNTMYL
ncbi:MAG: hypothetical protein K8I00_12305 [Candidatus Omnitrophica bacterium]|nr:hypothetical protein [Candidatus Omnitrophota bacterium]